MHKESISEDRKKYLRKILIKKVSVVLTQVGILMLFIMLWEILANKEIIDSFITSKPSEILKTFINLSSNDLWRHLRVTCMETIIGFSLGIFLGILIAIVLWWSEFLSKVAEPFLVVLNSLPKVALGTIIIGWVGAGTNAIIVMAVAISLVVKMAQTFNCTKMQLLTKIVIPANISTFINSLKINIGLSLVGVITGEFLVSKAGLRLFDSIWRSGF